MILSSIWTLTVWSLLFVGVFLLIALTIIVSMYFKYSRTPRGKRIITTKSVAASLFSRIFILIFLKINLVLINV
jgi:hypothetical protein